MHQTPLYTIRFYTYLLQLREFISPQAQVWNTLLRYRIDRMYLFFQKTYIENIWVSIARSVSSLRINR